MQFKVLAPIYKNIQDAELYNLLKEFRPIVVKSHRYPAKVIQSLGKLEEPKSPGSVCLSLCLFALNNKNLKNAYNWIFVGPIN